VATTMCKHQQEAFPKENSRHASKLIEFIHSDIHNPMATSLGGPITSFLLSMTILSFYASTPLNPNKRWLENSKNSKLLFEAQHGQKIKCLKRRDY